MSIKTWFSSGIAVGLILIVLVAGLELSRESPSLRSDHAQPAAKSPSVLVAITEQGKTFHVLGCPYIHGKSKLVPSKAAVKAGYAPCVHCEHQLLGN